MGLIHPIQLSRSGPGNFGRLRGHAKQVQFNIHKQQQALDPCPPLNEIELDKYGDGEKKNSWDGLSAPPMTTASLWHFR
jgi:hypothetical protein